VLTLPHPPALLALDAGPPFGEYERQFMITDSRSSHQTPHSARRARASSSDASEARTRKRRDLKAAAGDVYRNAILDAAKRVFGRTAFAEAKIAEIAREAGMASGTLYNYFDSKEQIFQSLLEARGEQFLARLEAVFAEEKDPISRLEGLVRAGLTHIEEHRSIFVLFHCVGDGEGRRAGDGADQRYERYLRHYERAIRDAIVAGEVRREFQAADLVACLTGAMNGYVRAWLAAGGRKGLAAKTATLVDLFLRGAGTPARR
jgi:TetR/AcrR family fatty acid metabolism transcriptional regulator